MPTPNAPQLRQIRRRQQAIASTLANLRGLGGAIGHQLVLEYEELETRRLALKADPQQTEIDHAKPSSA